LGFLCRRARLLQARPQRHFVIIRDRDYELVFSRIENY